MLEKFRKWMSFNPPGALDIGGWDEFESKFRKKAPVRYFIKHFVEQIEDIISILSHFAWAIQYRTIHKYHLVDTKLDPGYHEIDKRMLHANFELLVDYVEIECANMATAFKSKERKAAMGWRRHLPAFLRFSEFRSRDLGIKHLEWETTLASPTMNEYERSTGQAQRAVQVILLYTWWKEVYPNRKELESPDQASVGLEFLSKRWKKENPDMSEKISQWSRDHFQQELDWDKEEQEMLIALMKIRKGLWT